MDALFGDRERRFRVEIQSWLREHLPHGWLEGRHDLPSDPVEHDRFLVEWMRTVSRAGWAGLSWPSAYGGRGASPVEQVIYEEEMALFDAPPFVNFVGTGLVGPTLIALGTEEQRRRHLSRILSGEEIWCQGYSEPNAGSDLAALGTRAERDGPRFVINGQKVWTSFAQMADRCFLLVRTTVSERKHDGITALIVDMHQPGVEVRPIRQITGIRKFNEVFFSDAVATEADVVGEVDQGWSVAVTMLQFERAALAAQVFALQRSMRDVVDLASEERGGGVPALRDPLVRHRIAQHHVRARAAQLLFYQHLALQLRGGRRGVEGSLDKLIVTEHHKEVTDLALTLLGADASFWEASDDPPVERWRHAWLSSLGYTLAGGTSEILRNVVAERLLGLPRDGR